MPDAHTEASTAHTYTDIATSNDNGVFVITLNRPDKLNAWRAEMDRDVRAAMRIAAADDSVRVIVLTGAGKGFCAGADMGLLQTIQKSSLGEAGGGGSPRSGETEGAGRVFAAGGDAKAGRSVVNAHEPWDPKANPNFRKQYSWFPAVPKPIIGQGLKAGDWVKKAAVVCGGSGGGKPDLAQAGGRDPTQIDKAIAEARAYAAGLLSA